MNEAIPYIITPESITIFVNGQSYTILGDDKGHYDALRTAIREGDWEKVTALADVKKRVEQFMDGDITVQDEQVLYKGEPIQNHMAERIIYFAKSGDDYKPLVKFMNRIMNNPSKRSIDELHKFLEHKNLPIQPDGTFLAYKAIRNDWKDKHSGTFDNSVGKIVKIERRKVDDDARHACSYGLHVGSLEYVSSFASCYGNQGGDRIVVVAVDPADVVSVPYDCDCQKVRCCKYTVLSEYTGALPSYYTRDYYDFTKQYGDYEDDDYYEEDDVEVEDWDDVDNW